MKLDCRHCYMRTDHEITREPGGPPRWMCAECGHGRCEVTAVPEVLEVQADGVPWHVAESGECYANAEIIESRLASLVVALRNAGRVRDRVRKEAVLGLAEQFAAVNVDVRTLAADLREFQQSLAAMGGG